MPDPSPSQEKTAIHRQVAGAVARERRRLADLLHRTASQSLTAAYYSALVLASKSADTPSHAADLAALPDLIHTAIDELREIAREFQEPGEETPSA